MSQALIFATHNENKVKEVCSLLGTDYDILSLREIAYLDDIPEPYDTLEANAREKSSVIYRLTGRNCFSEDTGLEIQVLGGRPGVLSARYAGPGKVAKDNIAKVLSEMTGIEDRSARFRTVISLFIGGEEYQFEGVCTGRIAREPKGDEGFGYDPIFKPTGAEKTFAQMTMSEKALHSHRARAFEKLTSFLQERIKSADHAQSKS
jgi:XTP/dITP diphosphohydrolase